MYITSEFFLFIPAPSSLRLMFSRLQSNHFSSFSSFCSSVSCFPLFKSLLNTLDGVRIMTHARPHFKGPRMKHDCIFTGALARVVDEPHYRWRFRRCVWGTRSNYNFVVIQKQQMSCICLSTGSMIPPSARPDCLFFIGLAKLAGSLGGYLNCSRDCRPYSAIF